MDSSAPTARFLQARITYLSNTLIKRLENIFAAALPNEPSTGQSTASSHTSTAIEQFQLDVESTALIRAAEEIMILTRGMKDIWLFGGLDTLEKAGPEGTVAGGARAEDVGVVLEYLQRVVGAKENIGDEPVPEQHADGTRI